MVKKIQSNVRGMTIPLNVEISQATLLRQSSGDISLLPEYFTHLLSHVEV